MEDGKSSGSWNVLLVCMHEYKKERKSTMFPTLHHQK